METAHTHTQRERDGDTHTEQMARVGSVTHTLLHMGYGKQSTQNLLEIDDIYDNGQKTPKNLCLHVIIS